MTWQLALAVAANLIAIIAGATKGIRVLVDLRDEIRDMAKAIGTPDPREGLVGDVLNLTDDMGAIRKELRSHRDSLIEITAQMGLRRPGSRT